MGEGGRLAELSPLIVAVTFLGAFLILAVMIPPEFIAAGEYEDYRQVTVPDYFEAIDVQSFAETWVYTMNETEGYSLWESSLLRIYKVPEVPPNNGLFGGHWIDLFYREANYSDKFICIEHLWTDWGFPRVHHMNWLDAQGVTVTDIFPTQYYDFYGISVETIESDIENGAASYTVKCDHFQMQVFIGYNTTLYETVEDAWDHHGLNMLWGIDFDQTNTRMNVWNLIAMILFFQMPNIHWAINALIALPLWTCIAYLTFVFISKLIPFT